MELLGYKDSKRVSDRCERIVVVLWNGMEITTSLLQFNAHSLRFFHFSTALFFL